MTDRLVELLHVAPAIGSAIFQPKYRGCRIRRLPVPTDCELVETALYPVIGHHNGSYPHLTSTGGTTPAGCRQVTRNIHPGLVEQ